MNSQHSSTSHMAKWKLSSPWQWGIQVTCLAVVITAYFVFEKAVYPFKRGFFCNDETIRYPYNGQTFTFRVALGIGLAISIPTIIVVRMYNNYRHYSNFRPLIPLLKDIMALAYGAFACQATLDVAKVIVGRLRPSFLFICFGNNMTTLNNLCDNFSDTTYITDFECSCSAKDEREARLSFPSGHTSFMMYIAVFTMCYLQRRSSERFIKLLLATIQVLYLNVALAIAMTRISDYKHHWNDVMVGGFYGVAAGFLTAHYLLEDDPKSEDTIPLRKNNHKDVETNYTNVEHNEREVRPIHP